MKKLSICPICNSRSHLVKKNAEYSFFQCESCKVCYSYPFPGDISKIYDDYFFNQGYKTNYFGYLPLIKNSLYKKIRLLQVIYPEFQLGTTKRFLDIGCGSGLYVHAAKLIGFDAYGIDIDEKSILIAKEQGLYVEKSDIFQASFQQNYFDLIQMKEVLEHLPNPKESLIRVRSILKKNGILMIDVPNQNGIIPKIKRSLKFRKNEWGFVQPPVHLFAYEEKSLRNILEAAGFEVIWIGQSVPGDPVFYPILKQNIAYKIIFKLSYVIRMGSILVAYAKKR